MIPVIRLIRVIRVVQVRRFFGLKGYQAYGGCGVWELRGGIVMRIGIGLILDKLEALQSASVKGKRVQGSDTLQS